MRDVFEDTKPTCNTRSGSIFSSFVTYLVCPCLRTEAKVCDIHCLCQASLGRSIEDRIQRNVFEYLVKSELMRGYGGHDYLTMLPLLSKRDMIHFTLTSDF